MTVKTNQPAAAAAASAETPPVEAPGTQAGSGGQSPATSAPALGTPSLAASSREAALKAAVEIMQKGLKPGAQPAPAAEEADPEEPGVPAARAGGEDPEAEEEGEESAAAAEEGEGAAAEEDEALEAAPAKQDRLARSFAILAEREAALVRQQAELKPRLADLDRLEKAREEAKRNPLALLEAHGLSLDDVNEYVINGKKPTPELAAKTVDEELKRMREERKKWEEERAAERAAEKRDAVRGRLATHIASDAEKYELINTQREHELVFDVILAHAAKNNGAWLGGSEAAAFQQASEQVEAYLEEQAKRLLQTKKLSGTIPSAATKRAVPGHERTGRPQKQQPRTLTNGHTAAPLRKPPEQMTEEERLAAATAAIKFRPGT